MFVKIGFINWRPSTLIKKIRQKTKNTYFTVHLREYFNLNWQGFPNLEILFQKTCRKRKTIPSKYIGKLTPINLSVVKSRFSVADTKTINKNIQEQYCWKKTFNEQGKNFHLSLINQISKTFGLFSVTINSSPKQCKFLLAGIYLVQINNGNTGTMREICSKLVIKTTEGHHWRRFGVFFVNF